MAMNATVGANLHGAIRYSFTTGDRVYAIVDAARDVELAKAAPGRLGDDVQCLFAPDVASHMYPVAPYLVPVAYRPRYPYPDSGFLDLWAKHLGNSAGILLLSDTEPEPLCAHLRDLFLATDEEDHPFFFRYYDPRVLRLYLPTCTGPEAAEFFGPVSRILCEAAEPNQMLVCRPEPEGAGMKERPL